MTEVKTNTVFNQNIFVINIQPHNYEECRKGLKFGIRKGGAHPKFFAGDIFLVRITGRDYGVKGIWVFENEKRVEDQEEVPWKDADYEWVQFFYPLILEFKSPFSEGFTGRSKFSERLGFSAMRLVGSVVQLRPAEIVRYLKEILKEKQEECSINVTYHGIVQKASELFQGIIESFEKIPEPPAEEVEVPTTAEEAVKPRPDDIVGPPINFRGIVYAPLNETGVALLFSKIMDDLGIIYESSPSQYPDMVGRIQTNRGFEKKYFEFEYKSSNFQRHGHNPALCDYIVCWEHDWEECPDNIQVIELKQKIREFPAEFL